MGHALCGDCPHLLMGHVKELSNDTRPSFDPIALAPYHPLGLVHG
jgi:hypothetical protein